LDVLSDGEHPEIKNSKALAVIERVKNKLTGMFARFGPLSQAEG